MVEDSFPVLLRAENGPREGFILFILQLSCYIYSLLGEEENNQPKCLKVYKLWRKTNGSIVVTNCSF